MRLLRGRSSLLWILLLVGSTLTVVIGAAPGRARAATTQASVCIRPVGCGSTTTSPTTPPTTAPVTTTTVPGGTVPASPYSAAFVPCGSTSGPCDQEPAQVQLQYSGPAPAAVQLVWVAAGRASGAPSPASTTVTLMWTDGSDCATQARCWQWPAQMTDSSFILNGTYKVVVCDTYAQGECGSSTQPTPIGLAVPPGPPAQVEAVSSGRQVTVTWQPPASAPPDLAGYTVARNGQPVYSCSTDGLGPGASVPCPQPLTVTDHPANGSYDYTVSALRLGVDTSSADVVSSPAASSSGGRVTVPAGASNPATTATGAGTGTGTGSGSGGGGAAAATAPAAGSAGTGGGAGTAVTIATGGPVAASAGPAPASDLAQSSPRNVTPPDNPVAGRSPLALRVHAAASRTDVVPVAVLALGILALAIAAHFLYLRVELGVIQSRLRPGRRRPA
jgi:hypothetical protein